MQATILKFVYPLIFILKFKKKSDIFQPAKKKMQFNNFI